MSRSGEMPEPDDCEPKPLALELTAWLAVAVLALVACRLVNLLALAT